MVEAPAAVDTLQRAGVGERTHQLLEEEWVAFGFRRDPRLELRREGVAADERLQQFRFGVAAERLERHLPCAVGELTRSELLDRPGRVVWVRAHRQQQEHGVLLGQREQPFRELKRRGVCPMHVFERDDDRALGRQLP